MPSSTYVAFYGVLAVCCLGSFFWHCTRSCCFATFCLSFLSYFQQLCISIFLVAQRQHCRWKVFSGCARRLRLSGTSHGAVLPLPLPAFPIMGHVCGAHKFVLYLFSRFLGWHCTRSCCIATLSLFRSVCLAGCVHGAATLPYCFAPSCFSGVAIDAATLLSALAPSCWLALHTELLRCHCLLLYSGLELFIVGLTLRGPSVALFVTFPSCVRLVRGSTSLNRSPSPTFGCTVNVATLCSFSSQNPRVSGLKRMSLFVLLVVLCVCSVQCCRFVRAIR